MSRNAWSRALVFCVVCLGSGALALPALASRHRVRIEGQGARTVILESGLGDTLEIWREIQPQIAASCTRTVSYNRAGYPESDPASGPRDAATVVAELRAELKERGVGPPYVLVGHSLGGLYMQYFARNFPEEVAGLVLVDSTHWNQGLQVSDDSSGPYTKYRAVTLFMPWIMRREVIDSAVAGEQVHASPAARNVPTIVLSSTRALMGETPATRAQAARFQDEIVADFPAARHIRVDESGHYIQRDRPEVVVQAARELAGCTPLVAKTVETSAD
jgi:pimeloyl-ACP methyl ester carboxylesterase